MKHMFKLNFLGSDCTSKAEDPPALPTLPISQVRDPSAVPTPQSVKFRL